MPALRFFRYRRITRPLIGCLAIFTAMALLSTTMIRPTSAAGSQDGSTQRPEATFPTNSTLPAAIPDSPGGTPPTYGTPLVLNFPVTGVSANVSDVSISVTVTHTWCGDVDMVLAAPGGSPNLVVVGHIGVTAAGSFGSSSDYSGTYVFSDTGATTNIWTAAVATPVPAGTYRTTVRGMAGTTNPPTVTSLNSTFGGLTPAQANGTWTLTVRDGASGDTGTITASSLTVNPTGPPIIPQHIVDFDGDGKTDPAVVRNTGGGPTGQITWFAQNSSGAPASTTVPWGLNGDRYVPEDYDGDSKTDIAVWRQGPPFGAYFYILQSQTGTLRIDQFGQTGDDPTVIGDYDGDNKADPAVYRGGAVAGAHSFWYYRSSINGLIIGTEWGQNGDFPAPGDYDGDGKFDYAVQRNAGGGQARFFIRRTTGGDTSVIFGTPTDVVVPGDYDGDGKYDIATIRDSGGTILWSILRSSDSGTTSATFGASATDFGTQGDWDGDGKTDIAVWRPNADPTMNFFYIRRSSTGVDAQVEWGQNGDNPVANYNSH